MIRYDIAPDRLNALVHQHKPGWTDRARTRTDSCREKGRYEESSSIWGDVKPVFMEVQGAAKCCFCERKFEGDFNRHELDLEHFRPKGRVKEWPCPPDLSGKGVSPTAPPASNRGYYLLSYHLLNYAVACRPCNAGLKKDYFPILGRYDFGGEDPREMKAERPWLLYPIGRLDIDPEEVIAFYGILPLSRSADPHLRLRGLVTIAFFRLDDVVARKDLMRERAMVVLVLHGLLMKAEQKEDSDAVVLAGELISPSAPHANCARSFVRLFRSNRTEAREVARDAERFLGSGSL